MHFRKMHFHAQHLLALDAEGEGRVAAPHPRCGDWGSAPGVGAGAGRGGAKGSRKGKGFQVPAPATAFRWSIFLKKQIFPICLGQFSRKFS